MPATDAEKRATAKYQKKAYDDIRFRVPTGEREKIQERAISKGMSVNAYLLSLVKEDIEK